MNKKIGLAWGLVFLTMFSYLFFIQDSLPERLAVHFGVSGQPNGFQSKDVFVITFRSYTLILNALFLGLFLFMNRLLMSLINIPWKSYWSATEERMAEARRKVQSVMGLVGIFICVIFLITEHIIYQANAANPWFVFPISGGIVVIFALILTMIALSIVMTKPPAENL